MKKFRELFFNYDENRFRALFRIVGQSLLTIVFFMVVGIPASTIAQWLGISLPIELNRLIFPFFSAVVITASVLLARKIFDKRSISSLGFNFNKNWRLDFWFGFFLGFFLMTLIFLAQLAFGWIEFLGFSLTLSNLINVFTGLIVFIFVGYYEEVYSRGYQLVNLFDGFFSSSTGKQISMFLAVLFSSAFFGYLHINNPNATTISTINIMLAGFLLAAGMVFTRQLAIPIGLHISWNFFQGNFYGFPVSGTTPAGSLIEQKQQVSGFLTGGDFGPEGGLIGILAMLLGIALSLAYLKKRYGALNLNSWNKSDENE